MTDRDVWDAILRAIAIQLNKALDPDLWQMVWRLFLDACVGLLFRDDPEAFMEEMKAELRRLG